jgi:hypothetical protein
MEVSRLWRSGVQLQVFRYMLTDVSKEPAAYFLRLMRQVVAKCWFKYTRMRGVASQNTGIMVLLFALCACGKTRHSLYDAANSG